MKLLNLYYTLAWIVIFVAVIAFSAHFTGLITLPRGSVISLVVAIVGAVMSILNYIISPDRQRMSNKGEGDT